jgi:hypothetical protein
MDKENGFLTLSSLRPLRDCQGNQLSDLAVEGICCLLIPAKTADTPLRKIRFHAAANDMAAERGDDSTPGVYGFTSNLRNNRLHLHYSLSRKADHKAVLFMHLLSDFAIRDLITVPVS